MDYITFLKKVSKLDLTRAGQAIALLWFYRQNQLYDERSVSELADDLFNGGLGRPNVTLLKKDLQKSPITVKGKRINTFQINVKYLDDLDNTYGQFIDVKNISVTSSVLDFDMVKGTRRYIEKIVFQINGSYDFGFYDGCAVLIRRLLESLMIEVFISKSITQEIKSGGVFLGLEQLINKINLHTEFNLGRKSGKHMTAIKEIGDNAAHDRVYITQKQDIDEIKKDTRVLIQELLFLSGIIK